MKTVKFTTYIEVEVEVEAEIAPADRECGEPKPYVDDIGVMVGNAIITDYLSKAATESLKREALGVAYEGQ